MNYIMTITTVKRRAFKTYDEACKKMTEEFEKLNRQIMASDLTGVTGYTLELKEWIGGNAYKTVAIINYDLAL